MPKAKLDNAYEILLDYGYIEPGVSDRVYWEALKQATLDFQEENNVEYFDIVRAEEKELRDKVVPKSFDCVVALDLIEHLDKSDGFKLIKIMESIARKKVIIFTPNGFLKQEPYDDNIWQEHKSGWEVDEMKDLGFQVYGQGGLKYLRGDQARIKYRPEFFWSRLSYISQKIVEENPKYSFQLLCVKNLDVDKK